MGNPLAPEWLSVPAITGTDITLDQEIWPSNLRRQADAKITLAGKPISELAAKYSTPLYLYDQDFLLQQAADVKRIFEEAAAKIGTTAHIYYAGKAFLSAQFVRWMVELGLSVDVCSAGELAVALAAGVDPSSIGLHGNNKSEYEIRKAISAGIGVIVIDSEPELHLVARIAAELGRHQQVRLRINTGVHAHTHEYLATAREDQKFGVAMSDAETLVDKIAGYESLDFLGMHAHIGSQIYAPEGFQESANRLLDIHARLLKKYDVPELNLGGGFGVKYVEADTPIPLEEMASGIMSAVASRCKELGIKPPALAFEPGRAITAQAGIALYTVGTIKDVEVQLDNSTAIRRYVAIDGGMSDNLRPALYGANYSVMVDARTGEAGYVLSRVVGKHCESGDIVVHDCYLPADITSGDILAIASTGAYCVSLSSNYNYLERPATVAISPNQETVLLQRETEEDLLRRDGGING